MAISLLSEQTVAENPVFVRLTVDQLHQMLATGVIREGEPVELIDGLLVYNDRRDAGGKQMSHGPRHAVATENLGELNLQLRPLEFIMRTQKPVVLSDMSEPEPDGAIVEGDSRRYSSRHPHPHEIQLVIEVADTSLSYDRTVKQRLYAAAQLPVYWIVNLQENVVEVYSDPAPAEGRYREVKRHRRGEPIELTLGAAALIVDPNELLP
jgi:Uma2 family endonuclease